MKMLKTKHFRRLAVFLAMIAPAVYLFGSQFAALSGAHGEQVLAQPDDATLTFEVTNWRRGYSTTSTWGTYTEATTARSSVFIDVAVGWYIDVPSFPSGIDLVIDVYNENGGFSSSIFTNSGERYYFTGLQTKLGFIVRYRDDPSYIVPDLYLVYPDYYEPSTYADTLFGSFFSPDNFLVQWGENAISDNPRGFAPFGVFWRYLDTNVLHLSNDQVGLMGYGYIYYACHVLLFDIGFILVTFFLDFIQKIADKFTGGE